MLSPTILVKVAYNTGGNMKKTISCIFVLSLAISAFCAGFTAGKTVYVSVKTAKVKNGTSFFAKNVGNVSYGNSGTVVQSNGKNTQVKFSNGVTGWITNGSLSSKKIVASTGSAGRVSTTELANAGKGFSAEAEKAFKSSNKNLDYNDVDELEKVSVSDAEIQNFIEEGHLSRGEE